MIVGGKIATLDETMEDVWTDIQDLFIARGVECEFVYGPQNRELNGSPPRIQFERTSGTLAFSGIRSGDGQFAGIVQACTARIWGLRKNESYEKNQCLDALRLLVELMGAFYAVAPTVPLLPDGGVSVEYTPETHMLHYGEQFLVTLQFVAPLKWVDAGIQTHTRQVKTTLNTRAK